MTNIPGILVILYVRINLISPIIHWTLLLLPFHV